MTLNYELKLAEISVTGILFSEKNAFTNCEFSMLYNIYLFSKKEQLHANLTISFIILREKKPVSFRGLVYKATICICITTKL